MPNDCTRMNEFMEAYQARHGEIKANAFMSLMLMRHSLQHSAAVFQALGAKNLNGLGHGFTAMGLAITLATDRCASSIIRALALSYQDVETFDSFSAADKADFLSRRG